MLVLSRKRNESVILPDLNIKVVVVSIRGDKVRLGIEAPMDVKILREELEDISSFDFDKVVKEIVKEFNVSLAAAEGIVRKLLGVRV